MNKYFWLAAFALTATSAHAGELSALHAESVDLGDFRGVVYYTAERDGYRVVTTLASGTEGQPIRFVSTLQPGQRVTISVPQAVGRPSIDFEIARTGKALLVGKPAPVSMIGQMGEAAAAEITKK